jgi:anti-anti-sigma regulatory factor
MQEHFPKPSMILSLSGSLSKADRDSVRAFLAAGRGPYVIVDLHSVDSIDTAIADELVRLRNVLAARGERLALSVRASSQTARLLRSRRIDRLIRIFPTTDWALQAA